MSTTPPTKQDMKGRVFADTVTSAIFCKEIELAEVSTDALVEYINVARLVRTGYETAIEMAVSQLAVRIEHYSAIAGVDK